MARAPTTNRLLPRPLAALTPHDRWLAARTAATALLLVAAAALLMARTDEPTSGWSDRLARLGAMGPALGALAASVQVDQARRRGESMALALAGAGPLRQALGAALGGALVGLALAAAVFSSAPSLRALFPVAVGPSWQATGGGFASPALGLWLDHPGGAVEMAARSAHTTVHPDRFTLAIAVAVGAAVAPWWAATPCPPWQRAGLGVASLLGAVACFHAVALGAPAAVLLLPSLLLAAHLLARRSSGHEA